MSRREEALDQPERPLALSQEAGVPTLVLRGSVDVRCAAELHRLAMQLAEGDGLLQVRAADLSRLDENLPPREAVHLPTRTSSDANVEKPTVLPSCGKESVRGSECSIEPALPTP